jgi:mono/diheme cytochrome c family protein
MSRCLVLASILIVLPITTHAAQKIGEVQPERAPEVVYAKTCGYCHGRNVGPIILGRKISANLTKVMVRNGLNGMPAFRPTEISDSELQALARWIARSKKSQKDIGG